MVRPEPRRAAKPISTLVAASKWALASAKQFCCGTVSAGGVDGVFGWDLRRNEGGRSSRGFGWPSGREGDTAGMSGSIRLE